MSNTTESTSRYARQAMAFPEERRRASALALAGGSANDPIARAVVLGACAMGIPLVASDFHGQPGNGDHWLMGTFPSLAATVNPDSTYEYLDPELPAADLGPLFRGRSNPWMAVILNDRAEGLRTLGQFSAHDSSLPVIVMVTGPGGLLVHRYPSAAEALALAEACPPAMTAGAPELAILAAGVALNEAMMAGEGDDLASPRLLAFYSLHRPRRVTLDAEERLADLLAEISRPPAGAGASAAASGLGEPGAAGGLAGRRLAMVGAGALGNWCAIPLALEHLELLRIYDPDVPSMTNLNRQVLFAASPGSGESKARIVARELAALDPAGVYESREVRIETAGDLGPCDGLDAIICVPDNDPTRLKVGDIARDAGVFFATAGSSAVGAQSTLCVPGRACYRCVSGAGLRRFSAATGSASCGLVRNDAVVASNMVGAGLLVSELRQALDGRMPANIRFTGDSARGNRLSRAVNDAACEHRQQHDDRSADKTTGGLQPCRQ